MPSIRFFEVVQPPTSREVEELAFNAIRSRSTLPLIAQLEPTAEDPKDDLVEIDMHIRATRHPESGGMRILGDNALRDTVNLELSVDPNTPARLSMIYDPAAPTE